MQPDELRTADKYGVQSLTDNQLLDRTAGYGIISGGQVNIIGGDYQLSVTSATGLFGTEVSSDGSVTPHTLTGDATQIDLLRYVDDQDPRKVIIALTKDPDPAKRITTLPESPSGPAPGEDGSAEPAIPEGNTRFKTERPAPVDLHERSDAIPIAEVWVGANATEIVPKDWRDRRLSPTVEASFIHTDGIRLNSLFDGAGVEHTGELADRTDIPTVPETRHRINTDPDHGATANHNYYTDADTLSIVNAQDTLSVSISGSADTVDGYHGSELAKIGHNHDARYIEDRDGEITATNLNFDPFTQAEYNASLPDTLASGTATGTGGQDPAAVVTATGVTNDITADLTIDVTVASDPGFNATFGYSYAWEQTWTGSAYDVEIVITWGENPGNGNDVSFDWVVEKEDR